MVTELIPWVLLSYSVPREPSTPRIAIWRKLNDLGAAKIGDGVVALPANDETREHVQWLAVRAREAGGRALVWHATLADEAAEEEIRSRMNDERAEEYAVLLAEVSSTSDVDGRTLNRWRRTWRAIDKRDYFGAPNRDAARLAIADRVPASPEADASEAVR